MRKISATYIFPGNQAPFKNGILICEDNGTVVDLIDTKGELMEQSGLEYYSGILVPGFVNAHCHLELSQLKGIVPQKRGLKTFLNFIRNYRTNQSNDEHIKQADAQMLHNGIIAVGDVSNTTDTLETKINSNIYYHTFAEAFGIDPEHAEDAFRMAFKNESLFHQSQLSASVTPHAHYSVSEPLFLKLKERIQSTNDVLSIHNQESMEEEVFYESRFIKNIENTLATSLEKEGSSINLMLSCLSIKNQILLVHNTYTTEEDIRKLKEQSDISNIYFVICPNSNLYIENKLPSIPLFSKENLNICIGTDSLASNKKLSVLEELITLQSNFPETTITELIKWACYNGARALKKENIFGSFEKGKTPGINLITGVDLHNLKLTERSRVRHLHHPK